jgi:N-acetylmuramoyl-L-alanine amidase
MARWASWLLALSMVAWTGLSAATGWWLFRDGGSTPRAEASYVAYDVAGPDTPRQVHYLTQEQAAATLGTDAVAAVAADTAAIGASTPAIRSTGKAQPVPQYAQSAGGSIRVRAADTGARRTEPAPSAVRPAARAVVVLDPGHGRGDPGATHYLHDGSGRWDITEAESNLRNAQLIRDDLVAMGYEVYLTRNGPEQGPVGGLAHQFIVSDLYARVALAKAVDADVYLAIHGNGASVTSISGPETWYCGKHQEAAANEQLARLVQRAMMDGLHEYGYFPPDRGIKEDAQSHHSGGFCQFVVTRETPVPAALLEFLFLSNDDDAKVLVDDRAHVIMARHVANALDGFLRGR